MQKALRLVSTFFEKILSCVCQSTYQPVFLTPQDLRKFSTEINMNFPLRETLALSELGATPEEYRSVNDYLTGQEIPRDAPIHDESFGNQNSEIKDLLGKLKNYWTQLEDPLDERILETIKSLSICINDSRNDFSNKYKHLVRLSADDMPQLIDELVSSCLEGPKTLISMIKISIIAYSLALAKNAKKSIADIATSASDILGIANMVREQQEDFQTAAEHIALAWNATANSMTSYMAETDKKLLKMFSPSNPPKLYTGTPSTSSHHTPDHAVGTSLICVPGTSHQSVYGTLTCTATGDLGFVAQGSSGTIIAKLVNTLKKPKPIERVLNVNLDMLIAHLEMDKEFFITYPGESPPVKIQKLRDLIKDIPALNNQWILTDSN